MSRRPLLLAPLAFVLGLGACAGTASYTVEAPPPRNRVEVVVERPGFVWVDGHWAQPDGRWVWRSGYYERERPGHVFVRGRYERRGHQHVYVNGQWREHGMVRR